MSYEEGSPIWGWLPNRALMLERLEHAFRRARRSKKSSAVLFIDLNRFKEVNDNYGHTVGDALLVAVGERLTAILRPGDTLARLYGDEFVILCEDLDDPRQANAIAARVDAALVRPFALRDVEVNVTASIGLSFTGQGHDSPEQLLIDADRAMYRTKRQSVDTHQLLDLRELHLAADQASTHVIVARDQRLARVDSNPDGLRLLAEGAESVGHRGQRLAGRRERIEQGLSPSSDLHPAMPPEGRTENPVMVRQQR